MGAMVFIARSVRSSAFVVGCLLLLAVPAWAQEASGIAGVVKDTSGAVLPGVTVEAASPALIEKVRSVVTDGEGRYNIVDLRPGTYTVTFSLAGFRTVRREGIQLGTGFTATINGDLPVGSLEETITVSGAAPLVDTQNVRKQIVASRELLDTLPTSTKRIDTLVTLTPGFTGIADVGGRYNSEPGSYHGKRGTKVSFDGMGVENSSGNSSYQINAATVEEMVLQTGGISAEVNADGPVMNVIPKEGSNTFRTILNGVYSNNHMESDNLTDALRARGLQTGNHTLKIYDESVSVGGPIKQDRLWFFGTYRTWGMARQFAGVFWNQTQHELLTPPGAEREVVRLTPWVDRPLDRLSSRWEWYDSPAGRLTWQASPKHKFNFFMDRQIACNCGGTSAASLQETSNGYRFEPNRFMQATWNAPVTSRLLLDAGIGASISQWNTFWMPGVQARTIRISDSGLGLNYGAGITYRAHPDFTNRKTQRFSATYVTGSHTMKTGVQMEELFTDMFVTGNGGNASYSFRNGVPISLTQRTTPYLEQEGAREFGLFVQDQWRVSRWTFNYGVRFDYMYGFVPAQNLPGSPRPIATFNDRFPGALLTNAWVGERHFDAVSGIPSWKDLNPRLGASWDMFGNGRTALKVSVGRYVAKTNVDVSGSLNPITTSVNNANRAWTDANRNYVPDCDLGNFAANGECGALDNANFGKNDPKATRWSDAVLQGWGVRDNNWEISTEVQHELTRALSLTAGYYRNTGGYYRNSNSKQRVTDNILVGPADHDTYCITAPSDPRLPGGGGYQVCGLSAINPAKFGQVETVVRPTAEFGTDKRVNDFIGFGLTARLPGGARVGGGLDTGRSVLDQCFAVDSAGMTSYSTSATGSVPQTSTTIGGQQTCRVITPFKAQTQVKLNGSLPLPQGFVASGVYQDLAGTPIFAAYAATNAEIAPSLGRNLAGGARTATVPLIVPQTLFEGRTRRLDLRLTKNFQVTPRVRLQANFDAYNALNSSAVQSIQTTFGKNWLQPTTILDPRILQVSFQLTF